MAAITAAIAAVGVGIAGYGLYKGNQANKEAAAAQQQALAAQQEAEKLKQKQLDLDATRRRREIIRTSVAARSASLAVTTAQGAAYEGGSALPGAYGGVAGRAGVNTLGVNQNQELGQGIFEAHSNQLSAYSRAAKAESDSAFYKGLTSFGGQIFANAGTITDVGTYGVGQISKALAPKGGYTGWTSGWA